MKRRTHFSALALAAVMSIGYISLPVSLSPAVSVSAVAMLSAPSGLSYSATSDSITLKWDALSGADAYRVYMLADDIETAGEDKLYMIDDDLYFVYKTVSENSCTIKGLSKNTTYHFRISALEKNDGKYIEGSKTGMISADTKSQTQPKSADAGYTGIASSGGSKYYYKNGQLSSGFVKTSKGYMYFDPDTYEMQTGFITSGGHVYYFGSDGIMLTNGTYTIGDKTYVIGADGKAKVKSTSNKSSKTTTNYTYKSKASYPSILNYRFKDITYEAYKEGYNFDVCATSFRDDAMDYFYDYLQEWSDRGYYVDIGDSDADYKNLSLTIPVKIYDGYSLVAIVIYGYYAESDMRMVTVSYQ